MKEYQPSYFKIIPPLLESIPSRLPFLEILHPPTLLVNWSSQVTVKLSSINTLHVKQQHKVGFFIFKFNLKYMPGNVYIDKIHASQCLYIRLCCREGFSHPFNFFVISKGILYI